MEKKVEEDDDDRIGIDALTMYEAMWLFCERSAVGLQASLCIKLRWSSHRLLRGVE
jgi:hypothetical protein